MSEQPTDDLKGWIVNWLNENAACAAQPNAGGPIQPRSVASVGLVMVALDLNHFTGDLAAHLSRELKQ
jgi:hypothetical protein